MMRAMHKYSLVISSIEDIVFSCLDKIFIRTARLALQSFMAMVIVLFSIPSALSDPIELPTAQGANRNSRLIDISGEIGTYGELYAISGRDRRRPSSAGRIFFKPTINILQNFTINFNLFLSTEGSSARQDINQIDINPKWGWGEAHLVDFTESYSSFTLDGVKIRGASLNLTPGIFRASVISGISQKEVSSSSGQPAYRRRLNGGKIGIGHDGKSHFDLIIISSRDDILSAEIVLSDSIVNEDSSEHTGNQNPESITPQENIVGAIVTGLSIADDRVLWNNEFSGSAITRDRRSSEWEQEGYPSALKSVFTPRMSSSFDIAFSSDIKFNLGSYNILTNYQYVGPGYISLGIAGQSSDRQAIKLSLNRRFNAGAVKLDLSRQNDNLIKQKRFTTNRYTVNAGATFKPTIIWSFNFNITYMTMNNHATDSSARVNFANWVFRANNGLAFERSIGLTNISLEYSYQTSGDKNSARTSSNLNSHTTAVRAAFNVREGISMVQSVNIVGSRQAEAGWAMTHSYSTSLNILSLNKRLNSGFQVGIGFDNAATSLKSGLRSNYKLTPSAAISLQLELRNVRSDNDSGALDELTSRLTITNRF